MNCAFLIPLQSIFELNSSESCRDNQPSSQTDISRITYQRLVGSPVAPSSGMGSGTTSGRDNKSCKQFVWEVPEKDIADFFTIDGNDSTIAHVIFQKFRIFVLDILKGTKYVFFEFSLR